MKAIWFKEDLKIEDFSHFSQGAHLVHHLGISYTELGPDYLIGTMPLDERTRQPLGILHGGASLVLAEALGSVSSTMVIDFEKYIAVGLEINANHLRPVLDGPIQGVCKPIQLGKNIHVWEIKMYNHAGKMNCISRFTANIISRDKLNS